MFVKRLFDIFVASLGLIVLAPLFVLIALIIKLTSSGPVFFRQERVGLYGKVFNIHKFRTMVWNSTGSKITIGLDRRITKVGMFLRKTKLDELPQLIDVLLGDMSLVGPRPEVLEYVITYPKQIKEKVLSVRPGITDWASITMINESELLAREVNPHKAYKQKFLPRKLELAVKYVDTRTFYQDIKILWFTVVKIFKSR